MNAEAMLKSLPAGVAACVCRERYMLVDANDEFYDTVGYTRAEFLDFFDNKLIGCFDSRSAEQLGRVLSVFGERDLLVDVVKSGGGTISLAMRAIPFVDDEGRRLMLVIAFAPENSSQGAEFGLPFRAFLDNIIGEIVVFEATPTGIKLLFASESFVNEVGIGAPDKLVYFTDVLAGVHPDDAGVLRENIMRLSRTGEQFEMRVRTMHDRGELKYRNISGTRSRVTADGTSVLVGHIVDVTELEKTKAALAVNQERMELAFAQTQALVWDYDILTRELRMSEVMRARYGHEDSVYQNAPESLVIGQVVHSESAASVYALFEKIADGVDEAAIAARMRKADGTYGWARVSYKLQRGSNGYPIKAIGIIEELPNISEAKTMFDQEQELCRKLAGTLLMTQCANVTHDSIEYMHFSDDDEAARFAKVASYTAFMELGCDNVLDDEERRLLRERISRDALRTEFSHGNTYITCEYRKLMADGHLLWVDSLVYLILEPISGDLYAFSYCREVDRRKKQLALLAEPAEFDIATNLYNNKTTFALIRAITENASESNEHCALLLMSIDNFDVIRDEYGLRIASTLMFAMGRMFSLHFPTYYVRGMVGDATAAVFVPRVKDAETVNEVAEKMLSVMRSSFVKCAYRGAVHCSVGACMTTYYGTNYIELFAHAQAALAAACESMDSSYAFYTPEKNDEMSAQSKLYDHLFDNERVEKAEINKSAIRIMSESEKNMSIQLMRCTAKLVQSTNIDESIGIVMRALVDYYAADRCSVFELNAKDGIMTNTYETTADGVEPQKEFMQYSPLLPGTTFDRSLKHAGPVAFDETVARDEGLMREFERLSMNGIEAELVAPLNLGGSIGAFLYIENPHRGGGDTDFLEAAGYLISGEIVKRRMEEKQAFVRKHDSMTGVLNRESLFDHIKDLQVTPPANLGMLILDIVDLNAMNHDFGREYCDGLITAMADCLTAAFDKTQVFRNFAGQFIVLVEDMPSIRFFRKVSDVEAKLNRKHPKELTYGYVWEERDIDVDSMFDRAEEMMRVARLEMAKDRKYSPQRADILEDLLLSIEQGQFQMFLQPIHDIATGRICGAEALARIEHPDQGLVYPSTFIPLLEREDLTRYLDMFMMEQALKTLERWKGEGRRLVPISLNFSRSTMREKDIVSMLVDKHNKFSVPRSLIELELTEGESVEGERNVRDMCTEILAAGFRLSLDCFGAKFAGFSVLSEIPFNVLKLDRSIVGHIVTDARYRAVAESAITLCNKLSISSVAKGVEHQDQLDLLKKLGCMSAQGYLLNRPMPVGEFEKSM